MGITVYTLLQWSCRRSQGVSLVAQSLAPATGSGGSGGPMWTRHSGALRDILSEPPSPAGRGAAQLGHPGGYWPRTQVTALQQARYVLLQAAFLHTSGI